MTQNMIQNKEGRTDSDPDVAGNVLETSDLLEGSEGLLGRKEGDGIAHVVLDPPVVGDVGPVPVVRHAIGLKASNMCQ